MVGLQQHQHACDQQTGHHKIVCFAWFGSIAGAVGHKTFEFGQQGFAVDLHAAGFYQDFQFATSTDLAFVGGGKSLADFAAAAALHTVVA